MLGDVKEAIEVDLFATCEGVTIAAGYDLPADFQFLSRDLAMWDSTGGLYPALVQQAEEVQNSFIELGWTIEARLGVRFIVYFRPSTSELPATSANRFRSALERAIMRGPHRSGYADWTEIDTTPLPLIWKDTSNGPVLEVTSRVTVVYTYDTREAPVLP